MEPVFLFCQLATGCFEAARKDGYSHPPNPRLAETRLFPREAAGRLGHRGGTYLASLEPLASIKCERIVTLPQVFLNLYVEGFERLRTKLGVFFSSRLVVHFDLEAQVLDHAPDFWGWLARCREVAVHEDGVGWIKRQRLETA